jgi:hypothetical protein
MSAEPVPTYSFEIDPRPASLGGGWRLRLLKAGVEVGGGVFPPDGDSKEALDVAHADAMEEAASWLESRETN